MTRSTRTTRSILPFLTAALVGACDEAPTTALEEGAFPPAQLAPPPSCPAQINLTVSGLSGSLVSDGSDYTGGVGGVAAHTSSANGNLMFNVQSTNPARTVTVTTSQGSAPRSTRIFTNNHEQGCGLSGMGTSSTGTAVLEVEWADASNRYTLRYGKNCVGTFGQVVVANKINTARSANVFALTGDAGEGVLCRGRLTGQPNWSQAGTAGAFTMTLLG
jgi:hypothetical protein